ncbi:hypothetical protein CIK05_00650 [Bdellovibrio sp. qaytius]|nr:hypothetical protein CIK05_00650 [Bdellovibrio sp. qaytius]
MKQLKQIPNNQSGFMTAEFLFAFTMVIGAGVLIFALTFALTTVEIAQYIVWSAARAHAVGNKTAEDSVKAGETKYNNLTAAFPLLTGNGSDSPWFKMPKSTEKDDFFVGDISDMMKKKDGAIDKTNAAEPGGEVRHPWIGVESSIELKLLSGLTIPFLGKVTESPAEFKFPIRGLLFRHPSTQECLEFYKNRFSQGVKVMPEENGGSQATAWKSLSGSADSAYSPMEDNGC